MQGLLPLFAGEETGTEKSGNLLRAQSAGLTAGVGPRCRAPELGGDGEGSLLPTM